MSFFKGGFSGLVSGAAGLIGGALDNHNDAALAQAGYDFQREVFQNQYQWKAADAKKAGLHPLAVLGGGSYSGSPVSVGGSNYASALGKLGEGIGDAFTAYKNRDEIAAEAAWNEELKKMKREEHDALMRKNASEVLMNNGLALEATRRASTYTVPMASGRESIPGQVDARPSKSYMEEINKFAWPRNPDGTRGDPIPSSEYREIYEDVPFLEFLPFADAAYHKWRSIFTGTPIDGYRHNWRNNYWYR